MSGVSSLEIKLPSASMIPSFSIRIRSSAMRVAANPSRGAPTPPRLRVDPGRGHRTERLGSARARQCAQACREDARFETDGPEAERHLVRRPVWRRTSYWPSPDVPHHAVNGLDELLR
jgi:hypothetical protein